MRFAPIVLFIHFFQIYWKTLKDTKNPLHTHLCLCIDGNTDYSVAQCGISPPTTCWSEVADVQTLIEREGAVFFPRVVLLSHLLWVFQASSSAVVLLCPPNLTRWGTSMADVTVHVAVFFHCRVCYPANVASILLNWFMISWKKKHFKSCNHPNNEKLLCPGCVFGRV